jgi:hypothetical protein
MDPPDGTEEFEGRWAVTPTGERPRRHVQDKIGCLIRKGQRLRRAPAHGYHAFAVSVLLTALVRPDTHADSTARLALLGRDTDAHPESLKNVGVVSRKGE